LFQIDPSTPRILITYRLGSLPELQPPPVLPVPQAGPPGPIYYLGVYGDTHLMIGGGIPAQNQKIVIGTVTNWPYYPVADVKLTLLFGKAGVPLVYTIHGASYKDGKYTVATNQLANFAKWVVAQVEQLQRGFDANTPIPSVPGVAVSIIPRFDASGARLSESGARLLEYPVDGAFQVDFQPFVLAGRDNGAADQTEFVGKVDSGFIRPSSESSPSMNGQPPSRPPAAEFPPEPSAPAMPALGPEPAPSDAPRPRNPPAAILVPRPGGAAAPPDAETMPPPPPSTLPPSPPVPNPGGAAEAQGLMLPRPT
jgi:hypothetical protein